MPVAADEEMLLNFYENVVAKFHQENMEVIVVMPTEHEESDARNYRFTAADFAKLIKIGIDGVSLMTYDFSGSSALPGPNSPLRWSTKTVMALLPPKLRDQRDITQKLLVGIPFYGYDFHLKGSKK